MSYRDFNELLHALRTAELKQMPKGANVFLSAGCAGRWYFDWISENYAGITRHLGIEAYSPQPSDLPNEVVWLADHIHDMKSVAENEVDLVFAGQTVEHLWPEQLAGFLCEANRVLKQDGWLVLDSPNRSITQALGWYQPEHTMEFSIDEIVEFVTSAGFHDIRLKGVWLCRERETQTLLPLEPDLASMDVNTDFRVTEARNRPEDSFVWWIEARKCNSPNRERVSEMARTIYDSVFPRALKRTFFSVGKCHGDGRDHIVATSLGQSGFMRYGPYVPLRPGSYIARFTVAAQPRPEGLRHNTLTQMALKLDVCADVGRVVFAQKELRVGDVISEQVETLRSRKSRIIQRLKACFGRRKPAPAVECLQFVNHELPFSLKEVAFGVEFRALAFGSLPIVMRSDVEFVDAGLQTVQPVSR